jgi:hypothetical protein
MRHQWVLDVLANARDYAVLNGLPQLADKLAEALEVAQAEIAAQPDPEGGASGRPGRRHH